MINSKIKKVLLVASQLDKPILAQPCRDVCNNNIFSRILYKLKTNQTLHILNKQGKFCVSSLDLRICCFPLFMQDKLQVYTCFS